MFHFKQFSVEDSSSPMKVGTDGVLLGAWTPVENNAYTSILDIGTGCGVIALMLAQRINNANIQAIDIDSGAYYNAKENFANSAWSNRLCVCECSIQSFCKSTNSKFDIIVSNPPFFEEAVKSNKKQRNLARHTDSLPFITMIQCVDYLLKSNGTFACILPFNEGNRFIDLAKSYHLPVMVHSCGSSSWVYEDFIEMGVDAVDTLQPEATNMSPEYLVEHFAGRLSFHGCISTAGALAYGSVEDVKKALGAEVIFVPETDADALLSALITDKGGVANG